MKLIYIFCIIYYYLEYLNIMDIEQGWGPGIEASCKFVYDYVNKWIKNSTDSRVWVHKVQIWEHALGICQTKFSIFPIHF